MKDKILVQDNHYQTFSKQQIRDSYEANQTINENDEEGYITTI
jgi:hypothetical protein